MNKLGVIVPLRNRENHLKEFLPSIERYLSEKSIDYEIIVVNQSDDKPFNRGKLLNIGFKKAEIFGCNYVAFHDVDMLPIDVDYSIADRPTHIATNYISDGNYHKEFFEDYFGGVLLFPIKDFNKINGYSNEYWGWGFEDDDLFWRSIQRRLKNATKKFQNPIGNTVGYDFNGKNSKIKVEKPFPLKNYSILVSLELGDIDYLEKDSTDEYTIYGITEYDTCLSYNSFNRFNFETVDTDGNRISVNSDIIYEKKLSIVVTVDSDRKTISLYKNGKKINTTKYTGELPIYDDIDQMLVGFPMVYKNKFKTKRPFNGNIQYFSIWNYAISDDEVKSISENLLMGVTDNIDSYRSKHFLDVCLDMKIGTNKKIVDLSKNNLTARAYNCKRIPIELETEFSKKIPFRRYGLFNLLPHDNNGYVDNHWKFDETRQNQLRFQNQVLKGKINIDDDGLTSLNYTLLDEQTNSNITHLNVKL